MAQKLGLKLRKTNVGAQKINGTILETYKIVASIFFLPDKAGRVRFLDKTLLLANIGQDVVFKMSFLSMSNADINFHAWDVEWRPYNIEDVLLTTRQVEQVRKKTFADTVFNQEHESFIVYIAFFTGFDLGVEVYLLQKA